jgi:hypothetical protein
VEASRGSLGTFSELAWPVSASAYRGFQVVLAVARGGNLTAEAVEAIAAGCVPVLFDEGGGLPLGFHDRESCVAAAVGGEDATAERIAELIDEPGRLAHVRQLAFDRARRHAYRHDDMIDAYLELFARVIAAARSREFARPTGALAPPPAQVAGSSVFPVALNHAVEGVGSFPTEVDARVFADRTKRRSAIGSR